MSRRLVSLVSILVWGGGVLLAQGERRDLPARDRSAEIPRMTTGSVSGPRAPMPSPTRSTAAVSPSRNGGSTGDAGSGYAASVPVQTYGWDSFRAADWYRFNLFLDRLFMHYAFLGVGDLAWRYAQGDSPLTPEVVTLALRNSTGASALLQVHARRLQELIRAYEAGTLDRAAFAEQSRATAKEIRRLAAKVRKDPFVDYLDLQSHESVPRYDSPETLRGLASLAEELSSSVERLDGSLQSMQSGESTRVVSVDLLQGPSVESLSKRIDRIAKVIEKSVARL